MQRNTTSTGFLTSLFGFFGFGNSSPIIENKPSETPVKKLEPINSPLLFKEEKAEIEKFYNQAHLIDKVNAYIRTRKRKFEIDGWCNGLTLLWLYKMAEHQEEWFYSLNKKIIDAPLEKLEDFEIDIEKFISHVEWAQWPGKYMMNAQKIPLISQKNNARILEVQNIYSDKNLKPYTLNKFRQVLNKYSKEDVMITIGSNDHAIGLMQRGYYYYVYDSNYKTGRAARFQLDKFSEVFNEINLALYPKIKLEEMQLQLDISRITRQKSARLAAKQSIEESKHADQTQMRNRK